MEQFFHIQGVLRSNLAPVRNCLKGARNAKVDDIRSIGNLLTNFRKNSLSLVALNLDPKKCLKLKIKQFTGLILSQHGMN